MEFPSVGKHCHECNQLDFLPFECKRCENNFCRKHINLDKHNCPGTPRYKYKNEIKPINIQYNYPCSYKNCKKKEYINLLCRNCKRNFCINHRYPDDHKCHLRKEKKSLFKKICDIFKKK